MAGLDRFTSGPDHYWSDQKYVEGDPRRPVNISLEAGQSDLGKRKLGEREEPEVGEKETDKYAGIGIGLSGLLAENIVCHPFTILRRQCQVIIASHWSVILILSPHWSGQCGGQEISHNAHHPPPCAGQPQQVAGGLCPLER